MKSEYSTEQEMGPLPFVKTFKDLRVYHKARELAQAVFRITKKFPREEAYSLTDQWRRAARSIGAQIAEAWSKRSYERHFASKLSDADGEQLESQHWTIIALDCEYLTRDEARDVGMLAQEIGRMLGDMIQKAGSFCNSEFSSTLREETTAWFCTESPEDPLNTEY